MGGPPAMGGPKPAPRGGGLLGELKAKLANNPNAPPEMKMAAMAPQMGPPGPRPMGPPGPGPMGPPGSMPGQPMGMPGPGPMPGPPMGMPSPMGMPGPPMGMPGMGPPKPAGLPGAPGGLPGAPAPAGESAFDFSSDDIYKYVSNMENFLLSKKNKVEPFKLAQQLGFTDPEVFYNFIVSINREDLIKFDGGKIVVNTSMSPVDTEDFLKKFENYLKTGRL
jgi:hypothetical protein